MVRKCGKDSRRNVEKKVVMNIPEGRRSVGKPRKRWLDDAKNNLKNTGVRAWRGGEARDETPGN